MVLKAVRRGVRPVLRRVSQQMQSDQREAIVFFSPHLFYRELARACFCSIKSPVKNLSIEQTSGWFCAHLLRDSRKMQSDEVVWQIINHGFCSFKTKIARERTFCQNPYNVTGLCLRSACPLANSQYATVREEEGICYLFIKTAERAHTPKYLWEKIRLPENYAKALETISTHLEYFPKYLVHRNKQRLTKIHQMLIRMRKLKLKARRVTRPL